MGAQSSSGRATPEMGVRDCGFLAGTAINQSVRAGCPLAGGWEMKDGPRLSGYSSAFVRIPFYRLPGCLPLSSSLAVTEHLTLVVTVEK